MTPLAILAIIIAAVQAFTYTLPVTQDFAVVNQDRISSVIARTNTISLFNNGLQSSISYFGIDTAPFIQEAQITTNSPVSGMIESARLVFKDFTILNEQSGPINIQITGLNPGQIWDENTVTTSTTPTVKGSLGTVDFSSAEPSLDVTNAFVEAITGTYQGALFGFQIGLPGGPVSVPSHRATAGSISIEIDYSPMVGPGGVAPQTSTTAAPTTTTTTTTAAPVPAAPTTSTTAAPINCWTCGAGWVHWYEVSGARPDAGDPCACVRADTVVTTTAAPTTSAAPGAPSTAQPQTSTSTTSGPTTTSAPNQPERNSAERIAASAFVIVGAAIALLL